MLSARYRGKKTTTNGRAVAAAPVDMFICNIFWDTGVRGPVVGNIEWLWLSSGCPKLRSLFPFDQVLCPKGTRKSWLCLFPRGANNVVYKCVERILEETWGKEELGTSWRSKRTRNVGELENAPPVYKICAPTANQYFLYAECMCISNLSTHFISFDPHENQWRYQFHFVVEETDAQGGEAIYLMSQLESHNQQPR